MKEDFILVQLLIIQKSNLNTQRNTALKSCQFGKINFFTFQARMEAAARATMALKDLKCRLILRSGKNRGLNLNIRLNQKQKQTQISLYSSKSKVLPELPLPLMKKLCLQKLQNDRKMLLLLADYCPLNVFQNELIKVFPQSDTDFGHNQN